MADLSDFYRRFDAAIEKMPLAMRAKASVTRTIEEEHGLIFQDEHGCAFARVTHDGRIFDPTTEKKEAPERRPVQRAAPVAHAPASDQQLSAELLGAAVGRIVKPLIGRIAALEAANAEKGIRFRGYWREGLMAQKGDATTNDGSLWIAVRDTDETPSAASPDWCLAARKGRDGK